MRQRDDLLLDTCFTLNEDSKEEHFSGLLSLCNTTIQEFTTAVYAGQNSITVFDDSSVISNRGRHAFFIQDARFIKIKSASFQKCEGNAIYISQLNEDFSGQPDYLESCGEMNSLTTKMKDSNSSSFLEEPNKERDRDKELNRNVTQAASTKKGSKITIDDSSFVQI